LIGVFWNYLPKRSPRY